MWCRKTSHLQTEKKLSTGNDTVKIYGNSDYNYTIGELSGRADGKQWHAKSEKGIPIACKPLQRGMETIRMPFFTKKLYSRQRMNVSGKNKTVRRAAYGWQRIKR